MIDSHQRDMPGYMEQSTHGVWVYMEKAPLEQHVTEHLYELAVIWWLNQWIIFTFNRAIVN